LCFREISDVEKQEKEKDMFHGIRTYTVGSGQYHLR